jgi:cation diffusion facilitator family transporter
MPSSDKAVYAAIGANLVVAAAKFVASAFTGSSSMLAEGVHSLVDSANDGLLLVGSHLRHREPDETHPFGYGKEAYFWSLIVAVVIFALGGGVSGYEGVSRLLDPEPIQRPIWNYIVLLVAFLADGYSWTVAYRLLRASRGESNIFSAAVASKDPSNFAVLFEDTAAILGVLVAFVGVLLSHLLGNSYPDGIASLVIGLIMAATAVGLAYESKKLLLGESADPELVQGIRRIVESDESVAQCGPPLTMHMGPEDVLLNLDVQFREGLPAEQIIDAVDRIECHIPSEYKEVRRIFIEAERIRHGDGRPTESPRAAAEGSRHGIESCQADRTPADY